MNLENKQSIFTEPLYLTDFGIDSIMSFCDHVSTVCSPDLPLAFTETHKLAAEMFKDRHVSNIEFLDNDDFFEVFAKVRAQMKRNVVYNVSVTISKTNEVRNSTCECAGGVEPSACKHCLALLYAIENYSQKELYAAPTQTLQRWHEVKTAKVSPKKFSETVSTFNISTAVSFSCLKDLPFTSPIFDVLDESLFDIDEASYVKTVPLPLIVCTNVPYCEYPENLKFDEILFLHQNIAMSFEDAVILEKQTIHRSDCQMWRNNRLNRITASNFFEVCNRSDSKLAEQIYLSHNNDLSGIPAIKFGKENEPLVQNVVKHKYKTFVFRKTGLVINRFFPHLGASADGLLHNLESTFLVEIKCIFNPKNVRLFDLCQKRKKFCLKF